MIRRIFALLLVANVFPALLAGNHREEAAVAKNAAFGVPPDIGSLRLLAESSKSSANSKQNDTRELPQRREVSCYLIGPLPSMARAENFALHLESSGMAMERRWREISVGLDYWLYLPPQPSVRATTRILQELKARNINGFIISEGDLKGAVALGVFTEEGAAIGRQEDLVAVGYDAKIQTLDRMAREYWLTSEKLPRPGALEALMNSENLADIPQKISRRDCKEVASAMQFH